MIAIIDYGMGNLLSVQKAFESLGAKVKVTSNLRDIENASQVVLPGVGAFRDAIIALDKLNLDEAVKNAVVKGKPVLGICLGMQLLLTKSYEFGDYNGLNIVPGLVNKFPDDLKFEGQKLKIPHMGWNSVEIVKEHSKLFKDIPQGTFYYFVHSYFCAPSDVKSVCTRTGYGVKFTSAIEKDNVFACQFHPEKSQKWGLKILKNFTKIK